MPRESPEESIPSLARAGVLGGGEGTSVHPGYPFIEFFPQQRDFAIRLVEPGAEPTTPNCSATGIRKDDAGQRDGVKDARLDVFWPLAW